MSEKIAVLAPIATARVPMAAEAKRRFRPRTRANFGERNGREQRFSTGTVEVDDLTAASTSTRRQLKHGA